MKEKRSLLHVNTFVLLGRFFVWSMRSFLRIMAHLWLLKAHLWRAFYIKHKWNLNNIITTCPLHQCISRGHFHGSAPREHWNSWRMLCLDSFIARQIVYIQFNNICKHTRFDFKQEMFFRWLKFARQWNGMIKTNKTQESWLRTQ